MCSSCRRSTTSSTKNVALAASVLRGAGRASPGRCCRQVIGSVILRLIGHALSPIVTNPRRCDSQWDCRNIPSPRSFERTQSQAIGAPSPWREDQTRSHLCGCGIYSSKPPRHVYGAVRVHCAGRLLCGAEMMSAHYVAHRLMGGVLLRLTVGQGRSIDGTLNQSYTCLGH